MTREKKDSRKSAGAGASADSGAASRKKAGARVRATPTIDRAARLADLVHAELSTLLLRGEVRDPRAANVVISRVRMTSDLQLATLYVRLMTADRENHELREPAIEALRRATGFLRHQLGERLAARVVPDLRFRWDDGQDNTHTVSTLLAEAERDMEVIRRGKTRK